MRILSLPLLALLAAPASAQTADVRWNLTVDQAHQAILAVAEYPQGALVVRCLAGRLDVMIAGLSAAEQAGTTTLEMRWDSAPAHLQSWRSAPSMLFSTTPAISARQLRRARAVGLRMREQYEVPAAGPEQIFALPPDHSAVDTVLTACGETAEDPRDAMLLWRAADATWKPASMWSRRIMPEFPQTAQRQGIANGAVTLSCFILPTGQTRDCRIEDELPLGGGFGDEALKAARLARVDRNVFPIPSEGGVLVFSVRFQVGF